MNLNSFMSEHWKPPQLRLWICRPHLLLGKKHYFEQEHLANGDEIHELYVCKLWANQHESPKPFPYTKKNMEQNDDLIMGIGLEREGALWKRGGVRYKESKTIPSTSVQDIAFNLIPFIYIIYKWSFPLAGSVSWGELWWGGAVFLEKGNPTAPLWQPPAPAHLSIRPATGGRPRAKCHPPLFLSAGEGREPKATTTYPIPSAHTPLKASCGRASGPGPPPILLPNGPAIPPHLRC